MGEMGGWWKGQIISLSAPLCTGAAGQLIAAINVTGGWRGGSLERESRELRVRDGLSRRDKGNFGCVMDVQGGGGGGNFNKQF